MEKNDQSYLVTEKVGELMGKYAVTCIISLLVGPFTISLTRYLLQMPPISVHTETLPTRLSFL